MGVLIDTSVLIKVEREGPGLLQPLRSSKEDGFISVVTSSELLHGVWRAKDERIRTRRHAIVEALFREFTVVDVDFAVARIHAQIWAEQAAAGLMIGMNDLWLAATCITHGFRMATTNVREFKRIRGLDVEEW